VPLTYTQADINTNNHQLLRELARAFRAEGKLAELEGRTADAVGSYLDIIRLGHAAQRQGVVLDSYVGWAILAMGASDLTSTRQALDERQLQELVDSLLALEANREPVEDIIAREALWTEHAFGKLGRAVTAAGLGLLDVDETRPGAEQAAKRNEARFQLLICELALRRYVLQNGHEPKTLAELTPDYLPAAPIDPYSGKPLVYRVSSTGYQLYSVGPDGVDDGGKPMERKSATDIWPGDLHVYEPALDGPAKK
jgi:hypothetical protein